LYSYTGSVILADATAIKILFELAQEGQKMHLPALFIIHIAGFNGLI
jgi:hypothetical protein